MKPIVGINVEIPEGLPQYQPPEGEGYFQAEADCGHLVWIGPKIKAHREQHPDDLLWCALCALTACKEFGISPKVETMQEHNAYKGN